MVHRDDFKHEAEALGFSISGVTLPLRPHTYLTYEHWLAAGRHGSMAYLSNEQARHRRENPLLIVPEARSLLALGIRYPNPTQASQPTGGAVSGRVAAYAWGDDYHHIIPPRLDELASRLQRLSGTSFIWRGYTDTGPILERDAAQRAGLGWMGKNTCLIHPQRGSYFLLAEMLTSLEIEPDEALRTDHCGSCTRCIDACPTSCILPDRTIDATRCISYLTIENKAEIPSELRPKIGDWVFGCDICQMVCPWNIRFAREASDPAFDPRPGVARPILVEELELSPQAFNRKFKNNPVQRAKRRGYLRNVAVALGNHRDPDSVPGLRTSLETEIEPLVRLHVAWALGQIKTGQSRAALQKALSIETDPVVKQEINRSLEEYSQEFD
jgi:epoxyqueuosine reductase